MLCKQSSWQIANTFVPTKEVHSLPSSWNHTRLRYLACLFRLQNAYPAIMLQSWQATGWWAE